MDVKLDGSFKFVINRRNGAVEDTEWMPNLVLGSGKDSYGGALYAHNDLCKFLHLGRGDSDPSQADINLQAPLFVASFAADVARKYDYTVGAPYAVQETTEFDFPAVTESVVIRELGLSASANPSNPMQTRAIIKNSKGQKTSIRLYPGETFKVYYKLNLRVDLLHRQDFSYSVRLPNSVSSKQYNVKIRAAYYTDLYASSSGANKIFTPSKSLAIAGPELGVWVSGVYPDVNDPVTNPTFTSQGYLTFSDGYTQGSYERSVIASVPRTEGNYADGIKSMLVKTSLGAWVLAFQDEADPSKGLAKDSFTILDLPLKISWS